MNGPNWKSFIGATGSALLKCVTFMTTLKTKKSAHCDSINEVLFYGAEDDKKKEEIGTNNLLCIYYVIVHACRSLDVCLPTLKSDTISKCLINVHKRNCVIIRIVLYNADNLDMLQELGKQGISVKIVNFAPKLEHEFIIIDAIDECKDAVAVLGSLDYELSRVNCNRDSTLLTSDCAVIQALKNEFERIWSLEEIVPCE
ncbi:Mitochondrial cardiolipin hydrolase [Papilio xuthus]|uniref:Mitochondrial cardiolipin hydrolase n=1 Tax=Papilio xuthus TaxID=66420 RepID=A0A194PUX0_PAPXU|nr:Mitochondrial cardiolipin hydrolase [Papilio xuthus]